METNKDDKVIKKYTIMLNEALKILIIGFALQAIPYLFSDYLFNNQFVVAIKRKIFWVVFSWLLVSAIGYLFADYIKYLIDKKLKDSFWWSLFLFIVILCAFLYLLTDAIYNAII